MREIIDFNRNWLFYDEGDWKTVILPHSCVELPYDYCNEYSLHKAFRYRKFFNIPTNYIGREVFIRFEGALADTQVYLNSTKIASHTDGYTPFEARITEHIEVGENYLEVSLSGVENPQIPPFGGTVDFLCPPGLYREVSMIVCDAVRIKRTQITTLGILENKPEVSATIWLDNPQQKAFNAKIIASIVTPNDEIIATETIDVSHCKVKVHLKPLKNIVLWDIENPTLYLLDLHLLSDNDSEDRLSQHFGFRHSEFRVDGYFLNGKRLRLIGLNRHQSYPYSGYAMGRAAQEQDVEILKNDLGCNIVRTSHYPQSPWFLDHCDRLGLLVFEEIPGWQHIGDERWQDRCLDNIRAMIERDANHPSIIIWGVRINESADNHDFYSKTNTLAHQLDPSRPTGGVRCFSQSEFLEDVYTMNDFILGEEVLPLNKRGRVRWSNIFVQPG